VARFTDSTGFTPLQKPPINSPIADKRGYNASYEYQAWFQTLVAAVRDLQGNTGVGTTGIQGVTGLQGVVGERGSTGVGSQGSQGVTGLQGIIGATGLQGSSGSSGSTGLDGATGLQGVTGVFAGDLNIDGGSACSVYLPVQHVDGGGACSGGHGVFGSNYDFGMSPFYMDDWA
jgi:hypothetical protein